MCVKHAFALAMLSSTLAMVAPARAAEETIVTSEEPPPSGMRVALRSGFAVPIGVPFTGGGTLSDTIAGQVPLRVDIGFRIQRHFYIGGMGQLGMVLPRHCPSGASCSGTDGRVAAMAAWHFLPELRLDPWIGVGMGFEILTISRSVDGAAVDIAMRGVELLNAEVGADLRAARGLRMGPVLSTSVGRFTSITVNGTSTRDFDAAVHGWLMLGLRGAFDL
jgi:hypothetical protein